MNVDFVRNHPDVDLPEAGFKNFLQIRQEDSNLWCHLRIDDEAEAAIFLNVPFMRPPSLEWLRLRS